MSSSKVKVYGADWCEDTQKTREHLKQLGVPYDYIDIEKDTQAQSWVRNHNEGKQKTPTVDVSGRVVSVPDQTHLDRILEEEDLIE
jgi:glutaredoxin